MPLSAAIVATTLPTRPGGLYAAGVKRLFDLVVACWLIAMLVPVFVITAAAVWAFLGSPIFFLDRRSGRDGFGFTLVKFRSMKPRQAGEGDGRMDGPGDDASRLTPFGRLLRRTSLDELPQLFNVVAGQMSLIGPRPLPERYRSRYSRREGARLLVRPGITGWAQIHGRNALDWPSRLELDVEYVEMLGRWYAPFIDLWIGLCTVVQIVVQAVTGRGIAAPGAATMTEYNP